MILFFIEKIAEGIANTSRKSTSDISVNTSIPDSVVKSTPKKRKRENKTKSLPLEDSSKENIELKTPKKKTSKPRKQKKK